MTLAQIALQFAQSQIGIQEVPKNSNKGESVEKYLKSVGLGGGYAWCMAFCYWCFKSAATKMGETNPLYKTGGVLAMWNNSKAYRVTEPQPGDIGILDYGKGLGHAFIVVKVLPNGKMETIEGNSNDEGSREGYEVAHRFDRQKTKCKGFLRFTTTP